MASNENTCLSGFVYDEIMTKHAGLNDEIHVERPDRIKYVFHTLCQEGLVNKMIRVPARAATDDELNLVHKYEYIEEVKSHDSTRELVSDIPETFPTYVCKHTYEAAAMATGGCISLVEAVVTGKVKNGFACIRPPGHHAEKARSEGFCFFNNVAIAARYVQKNFGSKVGRILILDWDIHHGNGTQHEFYEDDDVMYISIHRYDNGLYYPGLPEGDACAVGNERGKGFNINIPWSGEKIGDREYLTAFRFVIKPVVEAYKPDILLISGGFDAAEGDPLGEYHVTPEVYGHMIHQLKELTNGHIVLILEGGYNVESMASCVAKSVEALLGESFAESVNSYELDDLNSDTRQTLLNVMEIQNKFWPIRINLK